MAIAATTLSSQPPTRSGRHKKQKYKTIVVNEGGNNWIKYDKDRTLQSRMEENEGENQQEDAKERQKVDQKREREEQKKEE